MANYYVLLTDHGKSFIANAQAGSQLALTHVVLGDAHGQPYLPESRLTEIKLVHQTAKLPVASIKVINETTAEVSAVVPSNVGGWNLHEVGITDSSGKLVYVGNFHGGYRPTLTEGAGGDMELVFTITADNLATVVIEMDGNVVSATRKWALDTFVPLSHLDDEDPHNQYVLKTDYNLHVQQNDDDHQGFNNWQDQHLTTLNPHSQYALLDDMRDALDLIRQRLAAIEDSAGVGVLVSTLDVTYSGSVKSQNDFTGPETVTLNAAYGFAFDYPTSFSLSPPIGNSPNNYLKDITITLPTEYVELDHNLSITTSSGSYAINQASKTIVFSVPVTSVRDGEGVVTDSMSAKFRINIYNK